MENYSSEYYQEQQTQQIDLPAGFRFHPTDEELITYYLSPKVINNNFSAKAIGEVDLNKCEPWDLPKRAKMGENEWYFFCLKDRKYPTGLRTNRATEAGYWKATGKDKEIFREKLIVGMKKTLVFYMGRAPKGEKSNWVMHEYRLQGRNSAQKNEWVICRVFEKSLSGKRILQSEHLPPLINSSSPSSPNVPCFSNSMNAAEEQNAAYYSMYNTAFYSPYLVADNGAMKTEMEMSFDEYNYEGPSAYGGTVDIESFLDYSN